jgi:hypothetical protein
MLVKAKAKAKVKAKAKATTLTQALLSQLFLLSLLLQ